MADPVTRSAAKLAALVAVPIALLAGLGAFFLLSGVLDADPDPEPSESPTAADTGPVSMTERELSEREQTVCRALLSQLPDTVRELSQRPVTAGSEQNAAYGDPPITVECGVAPAEYEPTAQLWRDELVCWHATEQPDATVWVTVDREVPVRVTVPEQYGGPGQWAAEFSRTISSTVFTAEEVPTGCSS